jgi:type VI secretion system protein ImpK
MSRNPFTEPEDDRTIMRPKPGGRRAAASEPIQPTPPPPVPPAAVPPASPVPPAGPVPDFSIATTPLCAAAQPIILLLARLWNAPAKPFAGDLRENVVRALRHFEQQAREAAVPMEQLRPAHFALCASIDDVVANTPWGSAAGWEGRSLAAAFHHEGRAGERFLDQLAQLCGKPAEWLPVIELMYFCLSLGFMGPYRRAPDGAEMLERVRRRTHDVIAAQRPAADAVLSPHWQGVAAPYSPGKAPFPVWVVGSSAIAIVAALFVWCEVALNTASDRVYAQMLTAPPASMPQLTRSPLIRPPPPPPEPTLTDRLRTALAPEIDHAAVTVLGTAATATLRINTGTMFAAGSATLQQTSVPLLERIAGVLKDELGKTDTPISIQVNGYTDNQPIRTVKFPSNFQLSASRADAVRDLLKPAVGGASAIATEGRADADPVDSNATPEGREHNRRIEIVLRRLP